jgi:CHASE1-domain containing sensor protein
VTPTGAREPAPSRQEPWPITCVYPLKGNETAWGFDLAAGHTREMLIAARDSNRLAMGPPRRLAQDPAGEAALFFVQPVFRRDAQGVPEFKGFVQGISRTHIALSAVIELAEGNNLLFDITDITDGEAEPSSRQCRAGHRRAGPSSPRNTCSHGSAARCDSAPCRPMICSPRNAHTSRKRPFSADSLRPPFSGSTSRDF